MIRRHLVAFLAVAVSALAAEAQPIQVRSGEHDTFTRVVLPLPDGATWELENTPGVSTLSFDGFSEGFDLSEAFEIIPRTRLKALLAQPSRLQLQLSCACPVSTFIERGRFLVMDVQDGPPLPDDDPARFGRETLPVVSSDIPESAFSFGELLWRQNEPVATIAEPAAEPVPSPGADDTEEDQPRLTEPEVILQTRDRLLEAFATAASRGLLEPRQDLQSVVTQAPEEESDAEIFDSSTVEPEVTIPGTGNVRITDSRDLPDSSSDEALSLSGASCPEHDVVALADWGTDESFNVQIGRSNETLMDELGRVSPRTVLERAKLYLHFGFGAEARQTLALFPGLSLAHPELVDVAGILEYGFAKNPRSLHRFAACNSDLALWGILAAREMPVQRPVNAEAALRALKKLPSHLKYFLAQELSKRFLHRGDAANASLAIRTYEKLEENEDTPPKIGEAKNSKLKGEREQTEEMLDEIIAEDTPDAPEAVAVLVDTLVDDGKPVPADIALLAEAFAFERKDTENSELIFRAFVLASAGSAQFDKAFAALQGAPPNFPDATRGELAGRLFSMLATAADDGVFLDQYFKRRRIFSTATSAEARSLVARRLLDLGFSDEAWEIVEAIPDDFTSGPFKLMKAELLLLSGNYEESLDVLADLEGAEAAEIRAQALEGIGDSLSAAEHYAAASLPDRAASALLLAENWYEHVDTDIPVYGTLSELANDDTAAINVDNEMLLNSQAAISSSMSARSALQNALETLQLSNE